MLKRCFGRDSSGRKVRHAGTRPSGQPDRRRTLGTLYRWREDEWADSLEKIGQSLGRFIDPMDAYDDLEGDLHHGRYNPLRELSGQEDFEELIRQSMMLVMGECTRECELLPLIRDVDILRNILYGGCWGRLSAQAAEAGKGQARRQAAGQTGGRGVNRPLRGTGAEAGRYRRRDQGGLPAAGQKISSST